MTRLITRRGARSQIILPPPPGGSPSGFEPTAGDLPGWTWLGTERFEKTCPLGSFPGSTYGQTIIAHNGIEDTSRDLGRPVGYRGLYNSLTTCSVAPNSSILTVNTHLNANGQPQVAMLVPRFPAGNGPYADPIGRRYSLVLKVDLIEGRGGGALKLAALNWPGSNRWVEGEHNFPEAGAGGEIEFFSHRTDGNPADNAWAGRTGAYFSSWHRFDSLWLPAVNGHPPRLTYILDFGTPQQKQWTIPFGRNSYGVPTVDMVRRLQFETWLTATVVPAGSRAVWLVDHVEEWAFNPATFDQTTYDLVR